MSTSTSPTSQPGPHERTRQSVRYHLKKNDSSIADLAKAAGLSRSTVSSFLRGASWPTSVTLRKISTALNLRPDALLEISTGDAQRTRPLGTSAYAPRPPSSPASAPEPGPEPEERASAQAQEERVPPAERDLWAEHLKVMRPRGSTDLEWEEVKNFIRIGYEWKLIEFKQRRKMGNF